MDPDEILMMAEEGMDKSVQHTVHEFGTLHTGKASPSMVENVMVKVESYGSSMQLRELAAITTPDARSIAVTPWDRNTLKDVEKAILAANLGLTPSIQGNLVRIPVPELSRERRQELVKVAHTMAEQGRVAIRHARHEAIEAVRKAEKEKEISEDDLKLYEKDIQKMTDEHVAKIAEALEAKEKDITTV